LRNEFFALWPPPFPALLQAWFRQAPPQERREFLKTLIPHSILHFSLPQMQTPQYSAFLQAIKERNKKLPEYLSRTISALRASPPKLPYTFSNQQPNLWHHQSIRTSPASSASIQSRPHKRSNEADHSNTKRARLQPPPNHPPNLRKRTRSLPPVTTTPKRFCPMPPSLIHPDHYPP
jgi:hypothetical protein